jgi:pilus assembly protein Flp/PilA
VQSDIPVSKPGLAETMEPRSVGRREPCASPVVMGRYKESKMKTLLNNVTRFARNEEGVTAIEYGLIASLIAVVIITAVALVGTNLTAVFNFVAGKLTT